MRNARRVEQWYARLSPDEAREYRWKVKIKMRYKLTPERYYEMLQEQEGMCAVCERLPVEGRKLCVDHCHDTGVVRGLLCDPCNRALGQIGDDLDRAHRMVRYLERWRTIR